MYPRCSESQVQSQVAGSLCFCLVSGSLGAGGHRPGCPRPRNILSQRRPLSGITLDGSRSSEHCHRTPIQCNFSLHSCRHRLRSALIHPRDGRGDIARHATRWSLVCTTARQLLLYSASNKTSLANATGARICHGDPRPHDSWTNSDMNQR